MKCMTWKKHNSHLLDALNFSEHFSFFSHKKGNKGFALIKLASEIYVFNVTGIFVCQAVETILMRRLYNSWILNFSKKLYAAVIYCFMCLF